MLDRQAAITHAEINHDAGIAAHEAGKILRKQIDELQEQVDNFCASEEVRNRLIAELTASAKRWADAANEQRLVAIEQADKVQELTAERDEWRAKAEGRESLAGRASSDYLRKLDECDELERERDELRETLKRNPGGCNHHDELRSLQKQRDKWQRTAEDYQKRTEELIDQRSRWIDAAVEIYRRFYPHKDYGVLAPEGVRDMVLKAIDELTAERDEWRAKAEQATNQPTSQSDALKTEETTENGATKSEMRDFDDSREKLEADVRKRYTYTVSTAMWPPSANKHTDMVSAPIDTVLGWLDRQVAITRAEVFGDGEFDCMTCDAKRELQECVEDLSGACELLNGVNEKLREQVDERARRAATRRRRT